MSAALLLVRVRMYLFSTQVDETLLSSLTPSVSTSLSHQHHSSCWGSHSVQQEGDRAPSCLFESEEEEVEEEEEEEEEEGEEVEEKRPKHRTAEPVSHLYLMWRWGSETWIYHDNVIITRTRRYLCEIKTREQLLMRFKSLSRSFPLNDANIY